MKTSLKLFLIISVLFLAGLACNSSDILPKGNKLPEDVLFQDDFSDASSGWDRHTGKEFITDYVDGAYRIFISTDNWDVWSNPGLNDLSDVIVEVDATKVGGPDDNDFGVICRYLDLGNYYFFVISSDGYYIIAKVKEGVQIPIGADALMPDETKSINSGNATNRIRADCVGSTLSLSVNDTVIAEVEDTDFISGDVGLIAGTFDEPGADIHFDNFVVRKP